MIGAGTILKVKGYISDEGVNSMINVTINFLLPALIFTDMLLSINPGNIHIVGEIFLF
jgi:predicted permease